MGELFGTDGVRGVANEELTGELASKLGKAGGYYLTQGCNIEKNKPTMIIGKDTRISGDMLEAALVAGITSAGINVIKLGIIPTPGVAYLSDILNVEGGVMISASHNPIADNGIKFFDNNGFKLTDEMEADIEKMIFDRYDDIPSPTHTGIGIVNEGYSLINKYIKHLLSTVEEDFSGLKIVVDCANGAAYQVAPRVLEKLGAELLVLNDEPDGGKINVESGSTYPEVIKNEVLENNADLGIAHDGDADRLIMVDAKGEIVDGDKIMAVLALDFLEQDKLKGKTLVTTAYSNLGLKEALENNGGRMVTAQNGDRYVLKKMLENDYNLGGEKSGHIICLDYAKTGDGVLTAIQVIQIIKKTGKTLHQLAEVISLWPQRLANVEVKYKGEWEKNKKIINYINKAENDLGNRGRLFVRASGTEPVIRIMLEGKDENKLGKWEKKLTKIIGEELN